MKKLISLLLCIAMLLGLAVSAFALNVSPAVDKTVVAAGEDVVVTVRLDSALQAVNTMAVRVYYDTALFEKKGYEALDTNISGLTTTPKTDANGSYISLNYVCNTAAGADIAAGDFCRITFTAKSDINAAQTADFGCKVHTLGYANATFGNPTEYASVSVTVEPAGGCLQVNEAELPEECAWNFSAGEFRTLDLSRVFSDCQGHTLTYGFTVKDSQGQAFTSPQIHFSDNPATPAILTFSTPAAGTYTLSVFAVCSETEERASADIAVTVEAVEDGMEIQYGYNETPANSVTVFATVSSDGIPLQGNDVNDTVLSHLEITVPYFDLGLYDLQDYYRYPAENGSYVGDEVIHRPTAMHLFIYLVERYYMGLPESQCGKGISGVINHAGGYGVTNMQGNLAFNDTADCLQYTGGAQSTYMKQYWGHDENLMYYRNHVYPLQSPGWGSTADYILLDDGDTVDLAMFTDWGFYTHGSFCTFVDRDATAADGTNNVDYLDVSKRPATAFTAETGTAKTFSAVKFGTQSVAEGGTDAFESIEGDPDAEGLLISVYDAKWNDVTGNAQIVSDYTDHGKGIVDVTFAKPGTYYLLGVDPNGGTGDACIAPATAKIVVTEAEPEETVMMGDVNGDGRLNAKDVQRLRNYLEGAAELTTEQQLAADMNGDGKLNAKDVQRLRNTLESGIGNL